VFGAVRDLTGRIAEGRQRGEVAAAMEFAPALPPPEPPGRIAAEMLRRSSFLRSKLSGAGARLEREVLGELDAIEAQARALEALGSAADNSELEALALLAFAVRARFEVLLTRQGWTLPRRAEPQAAEERRRELSMIDEFMARKRQRAVA
jgi:hypothetical protein